MLEFEEQWYMKHIIRAAMRSSPRVCVVRAGLTCVHWLVDAHQISLSHYLVLPLSLTHTHPHTWHTAGTERQGQNSMKSYLTKPFRQCKIKRLRNRGRNVHNNNILTKVIEYLEYILVKCKTYCFKVPKHLSSMLKNIIYKTLWTGGHFLYF